MVRTKLGLVLAIGLGATACSYNTTTTQATVPLSSSEQVCLDYGFVAGSGAYSRCVDRERSARLRGRVTRDYAEAQLAGDARDACYSYGLEPGTLRFDRCVGREIDARRWREDSAAYVPAPAAYYPPPPPVATVYPTPRYPAAPYVETRNTDTAGVQAFRDEYGFRYDGQGNRLDARGNIISPQSTQP
jgi:hypothetical protein